MFKDPFFSAFGESDAFILANAYPENIKAIGSTGRTNLLRTKGSIYAYSHLYMHKTNNSQTRVPELFVTQYTVKS